MQPKYNLNNKSSNLIQMNQAQKKKSRHRVIGSIVLLFIALVVLLNVTSNVRPIAINPQVVEIKNTSSVPAANIKVNASNIVTQNSTNNESGETITANVVQPSQQPQAILNATQTTNTTNNTTTNSNTNNGFKAGVVTKSQTNSQSVNVNNTTATAPTQKAAVQPQQPISLMPANTQVTAVKTSPTPKPSSKPKINPAAILDDVADVGHDIVTDVEKKADNKSYIQFAALSTQDKATKLQQDLAAHGVSTTVQEIQSSKGTLYRLRAGPFSKDKAQSKLQELSSQGFSGIVTSK